MATAYETQLLNKKFRGNVVIQILGQYFAISSPDSGLVISHPYNKCVQSLVLNPTQVDLQRANQTITNFSFKIIDKDNVITALVKDRGDALLDQEVRIWIGRITGSFDFSNYFELPKTKIKKISHPDNSYTFATTVATDRISKPVFSLTNKLAGSILSGTTTFQLTNDTSSFPTTGSGKLDDEFFSWSGKDDTLKRLTGVLRGLKGTIATAHNAGVDVMNVNDVSDNPLTILLKILISGGGGGPYDVYSEGLGIDASLIDVAGIEAIRDSIFSGETFSFSLYDIPNALKFIEDEILLACNCRFIVSSDSKISLALLDQSVFGDAPDTIDENSMSEYPKWEVDINKVVNLISIEWDWDEGTGEYLKLSDYRNEDSIAIFGERPFTSDFKFKGPKAATGGAAIVDDRADRFLQRFGTPSPEISFKTHISKHLLEVGEKVLVSTTKIPDASGTLVFANELEVISKGVNHETGDVLFKLAFTSYSGIRRCYIAPSDLIESVIDQRTIEVPAGRGDCYTVGWKMRLWDVSAIGYAIDAVNEIESIVGDRITFVDAFSTTLLEDVFRIKFADYEEVTDDQRRYCFISDMGNDFADGSSTYRVTF